MSFEHIMVDLETLSNREDAAIVSIGAVRFDLDRFELGDEFYVWVDGRSCQKVGLRVDFETVCWWMSQGDAARAVFTENKGIHLATALMDLSDFILRVPESAVWGNGSTFDNMILRSAFRACRLAYPVSYKNDLCYRTIRKMFPREKVELGTKHNALDDAKSQALTLIEIVKGFRQ